MNFWRGIFRVSALVSAAWSALVLKAYLDSPFVYSFDVPLIGPRDTLHGLLAALIPWVALVTVIGALWAYRGFRRH
jgi:hypothetical protein